MKLDVKSMCICSLFAALLAVSAFIKIPIGLVPITLQTLCVILSALLLGKKLATISVLIYIFVGLIGLPVFSSGGGIAYVLQPSFGYLIGFLVCTYIIGGLGEDASSFLSLLAISIFGMLLIYLCGILYFIGIQYFYFGKTFSIAWLFTYLFLVYLPGDILSCVIAVVLKRRLLPLQRKL